jgi:hypothetical protein
VSCYRLIEAEKAHHTVSRLARVLGVARAGYYAWSSRPASARTLADQALTEQIRQIHARSRETYGAHACTPNFGWVWTSGLVASGSPDSCVTRDCRACIAAGCAG